MSSRFICYALMCTIVLASLGASIPPHHEVELIGHDTMRAEGDATESLGWASAAGGASNDFIAGTVSFQNQSIAVAGWFEGQMGFRDQIDGIGATGGSTDTDFFVGWMDERGNWTSVIQGGSDGLDTIDAIAVLPNNDLLIAGSYCLNSIGDNCQMALGDLAPLEKESRFDEGNAYLARLSSEGEWMWSTHIENQHEVFVVDMMTVENQFIHLAVRFKESLDLDEETIPATNQYTVLVAMYDETGTIQSFVNVESDDGVEPIGGLCSDALGQSYLVMTFMGQVRVGETLMNASGYSDVAVASYSPGGWNWAFSAGGSGEDRGWDCDGNSVEGIYVVGEFIGNSAFGDMSTVQSNGTDFFVAKVASAGGWSSLVTGGGLGQDRATQVSVSPQGNAFVAGTTTAGMVLGEDTLADLDGVDDDEHLDIFLAELMPDSTWEWALNAGGNGSDEPSDISIGFDGSPVVSFIVSDDAVFGNASLTSIGEYDTGVWMYQTDRDGDGILDGLDNCPRIQNLDQTNYDGDAQGDACDADDDNDGVDDEADDCVRGEMGWFSEQLTDHDTDGCQDAGEDFDDDEDTVFDYNDLCPLGPVGWISTPEEDSEGDGCADYDTDEDGWVDQMDNCPNDSNANQLDTDGDGLGDACDVDLDGDGIAEPADLCPMDTPKWTSTTVNDHDQDGCHDSLTDFDDDADGILDAADGCPRGDIGWASSADIDDHDGDGCRDMFEDIDDDADGVFDLVDNCPMGLIGSAAPGQDVDADGCIDSVEDIDDDEDGIEDSNDACPRTVTGQQVGITGCSQFQLDDDLDGVANAIDLCQNTLPGILVGLDGCDAIGVEAESTASSDSNSASSALYFFAALLLFGAVYVTMNAPKKASEDETNSERKTYVQVPSAEEE